jgi:hypothetical protein
MACEVHVRLSRAAVCSEPHTRLRRRRTIGHYPASSLIAWGISALPRESQEDGCLQCPPRNQRLVVGTKDKLLASKDCGGEKGLHGAFQTREPTTIAFRANAPNLYCGGNGPPGSHARRVRGYVELFVGKWATKSGSRYMRDWAGSVQLIHQGIDPERDNVLNSQVRGTTEDAGASHQWNGATDARPTQVIATRNVGTPVENTL